ncbi:hypothetical protein [Kordia sp.]|uniref:hypothetical protein n=1 Tax=Kordia sp. TaxID=1965332 RepID=UPI003D6B2189
MKKKNLKTLSLTKSTISSLNLQTISGGTVAITEAIRTIIDIEKTATGCSELMVCDSMAACPKTVRKTQFKDTDTNPASLCTTDR